jgi:hypothetical protein
MKRPYIDFVCEVMVGQEIGKPIYISQISEYMVKAYKIPLKKATGAVSVACKRIMDGGLIPELRFYQRGIYYRTMVTPFGETKIDKEQLIIDKYLKNDIGYETGLCVLHSMGLTSQMPRERVIASNRASDCARHDAKLGVVVRPAKVEINAGNKQYLKLLDVLDILEDAPVDIENPYIVIGEYIEKMKLEYQKLLAFANNYYNRNTIIELAHVAGGGL